MANNNEFLEFIPKATLQGQDVLNVFHYQLIVDPVEAVDLSQLATLWGVRFDTSVIGALSQNITYNTLTINNLTDLLEFFQGSYNATGDALGQSLPVHDTISVKLLRQFKDVRNGRKSFSGVSEDAQNEGDLNFSQATIDNIEEFCGQPLQFDDFPSVGTTTFLNPIILRKDNLPGVPYDPLTATWTNVIDAQVNPRVRTQNSRKFS